MADQRAREAALAAATDGDMIWMLTYRASRDPRRGLATGPDDLQLRAEELIERQEQEEQARVCEARSTATAALAAARPSTPRVQLDFAWFPADQYARALGYLTGPASPRTTSTAPTSPTRARLELLLRDLKAQGVKRLGLTPITIDEYLAWCTEHDRDPEESETRASYATTLIEHGIAEPWPPCNETTPAGAAANASTRSAASTPDAPPSASGLTAPLTRKSRKSRYVSEPGASARGKPAARR